MKNASEIKEDADIKTVPASEIPAGYIGLDLGQESIDNMELVLKDAKTILWNGPLGYFELAPFAGSTKWLVEYLMKSPAVTVCGGGETDEAIKMFGDKAKFNHVSTGGGASMTFLSGKEMPAFKALDKNEVEFFEVKK